MDPDPNLYFLFYEMKPFPLAFPSIDPRHFLVTSLLLQVTFITLDFVLYHGEGPPCATSVTSASYKSFSAPVPTRMNEAGHLIYLTKNHLLHIRGINTF